MKKIKKIGAIWDQNTNTTPGGEIMTKNCGRKLINKCLMIRREGSTQQ